MTRHLTQDPSANVLPLPILAEMIARKRLRRKIERTVNKLIAVLDALEGDADAEPEEDADATADDPRGELDTTDHEPSLGAPERGLWYSQASWAAGGDRDEREVTCEDEGADVQAQPHDPEPAEPDDGWADNLNQSNLGDAAEAEEDDGRGYTEDVLSRFRAPDVGEAARKAVRQIETGRFRAQPGDETLSGIPIVGSVR